MQYVTITGSAVEQPFINGDRFSQIVNGKWQKLTPYGIETPEPIAVKFITGDYVKVRSSIFILLTTANTIQGILN